MASLHLAFYLASWGMYRGSSFLLWKDYKIHTPIVQLLLQKKYSSLWNLNVNKLQNNCSEIQKVFTLSDAIKEKYKKIANRVNDKNKSINPTDTLITKILLGTICCTPAYDRYFIDGARHLRKPFSSFKKRSYCNLLTFCSESLEKLTEAQKVIKKQSRIQYPIMKLIDMYFWNVGYKADQ